MSPSPRAVSLVLMVGLPAAGKTTRSEGLAAARQALWPGTSVVLDHGLWSRDERSALRWLARSAGAACQLVHLHRQLAQLLWRLLLALESIELSQIMDVLLTVLIPGTKPALLLHGQAGDQTAPDRPGSERGRWIGEVPAVQVWLPAVTVLVEVDRMHVDPARARCPELPPYRQPIRFGRVPQLAEYLPAALEVLRVDGQIKIPMLSGLPPGQGGNAPATPHPMTNPGPVQHVQDHDHVVGAHAPGYGAAAGLMHHGRSGCWWWRAGRPSGRRPDRRAVPFQRARCAGTGGGAPVATTS